MRKRNIPLQVMLDEREFGKLDKLRRTSGLSFSALIRKLIMATAIRERPNVDFLALARAVDRIGTNYNQIARKVNVAGCADAADMEAARLLLAEIRAQIEEWKKQWL